MRERNSRERAARHSNDGGCQEDAYLESSILCKWSTETALQQKATKRRSETTRCTISGVNKSSWPRVGGS